MESTWWGKTCQHNLGMYTCTVCPLQPPILIQQFPPHQFLCCFSFLLILSLFSVLLLLLLLFSLSPEVVKDHCNNVTMITALYRKMEVKIVRPSCWALKHKPGADTVTEAHEKHTNAQACKRSTPSCLIVKLLVLTMHHKCLKKQHPLHFDAVKKSCT